MLKFLKLNIFILLISLIIFHYPAYSQQPKLFIEKITKKASKILSSNISKFEKMSELKAIAKENVDINGIGLYTLGSHRKNLSDSQKKKYLEFYDSNCSRSPC